MIKHWLLHSNTSVLEVLCLSIDPRLSTTPALVFLGQELQGHLHINFIFPEELGL